MFHLGDGKRETMKRKSRNKDLLLFSSSYRVLEHSVVKTQTLSAGMEAHHEAHMVTSYNLDFNASWTNDC